MFCWYVAVLWIVFCCVGEKGSKRISKNNQRAHLESSCRSVYSSRPYLSEDVVHIFVGIFLFILTHPKALGVILFTTFQICSCWFITSTACWSWRTVWAVLVGWSTNERYFIGEVVLMRDTWCWWAADDKGNCSPCCIYDLGQMCNLALLLQYPVDRMEIFRI